MDSSQLKNKLTNFETPPPERVWERLSAFLPDEEELVLAEKLYNYNASPSSTLWDAIEKGLDPEKQEAKVIPFATRFKKPMRYISAAAIIAVILTTSTLLLKRTEAGDLESKPAPVSIIQPASIVPTPNKNTVVTNNSAVADEVAAIEPVSKRPLRVIKPQVVIASFIRGEGFLPKAVATNEMFTYVSSTNYMVYTDGNGMTMKVPKKLYPLIHCIDGDHSCEERIRALQQKLAEAGLTTDFGAVVEMLHQMQ